MRVSRLMAVVCLWAAVLSFGGFSCDGVNFDLGDIGGILDGNGNADGNANANDNGGDGGGDIANVELTVVAGNTGGASGMAFNPVDGGLYVVNEDGLFGPVADGADVSTMAPIGATNLEATDFFAESASSLVLAITNDGEFWIGSPCCGTLAVVPPEGGDAQQFLGLIQGNPPANIFPETMVIAPANVNLPGVSAGDLLVSAETSFSKLAAIDVAGDRAVTQVDNPSLTNRQGHHIAFGPDGTLYNSRGGAGATILGIQRVAADGSPSGLAGTLNLAAESFVVLDNGDLVLRGSFAAAGSPTVVGVLLYSAADESVTPGVAIPGDRVSEDDEMLIAPDGRILMSVPAGNEIVVVTDVRE